MTVLVHTFGVVADSSARILILGSMPGKASLEAEEYYAYPRNVFWDIMGRLVDAGRNRPYRERLAILRSKGIALWDVVGSCVRPGSLDADILHDSVVPNDFQGLFQRCPDIRRICFNGATAERLFESRVTGTLSDCPEDRVRLPSTSPANASLSFEQKLKAWQEALAIELES